MPENGRAGILDLNAFSDWLAATGPSQSIQSNLWAIPAIQSVHILALSVLFAAALILALRFAGRGLAAEPLQQLAARFTRLIWLLLVILAGSGVLLIVAEPHRTVTNAVFYAKMIMLAAVVLLTLWLAAVARRGAQSPSAMHRTAAALTVLLWIGIMFAGRFIAYYESI